MRRTADVVEVAAGVAVWATPAGADVFSNDAANLIVTVIWIVGVTNAFNLLDNMDGLNLNVARYTDEEIDAVAHLGELTASDNCYVWISARERGVGSGACGPDVSEPHRIRPGTYTWSYRIR